mmetsp:Transcript_35538/g.40584  ORF Transcript_35538/g.40584 Transcript_35538/m.40584 type:complete len:80 (+) Transcript_35538:1388-1627(+)
MPVSQLKVMESPTLTDMVGYGWRSRGITQLGASNSTPCTDTVIATNNNRNLHIGNVIAIFIIMIWIRFRTVSSSLSFSC